MNKDLISAIAILIFNTVYAYTIWRWPQYVGQSKPIFLFMAFLHFILGDGVNAYVELNMAMQLYLTRRAFDFAMWLATGQSRKDSKLRVVVRCIFSVAVYLLLTGIMGGTCLHMREEARG